MEGWKLKYLIHKADGSEVDPKAEYFVLRLDKDQHARKAALAYAESIGPENPKLAGDLILKVSICEAKEINGRVKDAKEN